MKLPRPLNSESVEASQMSQFRKSVQSQLRRNRDRQRKEKSQHIKEDARHRGNDRNSTQYLRARAKQRGVLLAPGRGIGTWKVLFTMAMCRDGSPKERKWNLPCEEQTSQGTGKERAQKALLSFQIRFLFTSRFCSRLVLLHAQQHHRESYF